MITKNSEETFLYGKKYGSVSKEKNIYCLIGDLAAGKTTFVKGFINYFSEKLIVSSPTFTICKMYDVNKNNIKKIYHFDLYRLNSINDLEDIGFFETINEDNSISLVEWPDQFLKIFPKNSIFINFKKINESEREINEYTCNRDNK